MSKELFNYKVGTLMDAHGEQEYKEKRDSIRNRYTKIITDKEYT